MQCFTRFPRPSRKISINAAGAFLVAMALSGCCLWSAPEAEAAPKDAVAAAPVSAPAAPAKTQKLEKVMTIGDKEFSALNYVCLDSKGNVYGGGADKVAMFSPGGKKIAEWTKIPFDVLALGIASDGTVYAAGAKHNDKGVPLGASKIMPLSLKGAEAVKGEAMELPKIVKEPASMKFSGSNLYVGDARSGIHKFVIEGNSVKLLASTPAKGDERIIATCCGILSFDVDSKGQVVVANLGQHRVTVLNDKLDGYASVWGKAGNKPGDFCGCCNPVSVAVAADGAIVTSEKTIPRLKIYSPDGAKLIAMSSDTEFGGGCANLIVAVDAQKRIYAIDEESRTIKVFAAK